MTTIDVLQVGDRVVRRSQGPLDKYSVIAPDTLGTITTKTPFHVDVKWDSQRIYMATYLQSYRADRVPIYLNLVSDEELIP